MVVAMHSKTDTQTRSPQYCTPLLLLHYHYYYTTTTTTTLLLLLLHYYYYYTTTTTTLLLHPFNGLYSRTTWVSRHQKGKPFWILLEQEMMGGSSISWTICKSSAPRPRHITTPVPHHSDFTGQMQFLPSNSSHHYRGQSSNDSQTISKDDVSSESVSESMSSSLSVSVSVSSESTCSSETL